MVFSTVISARPGARATPFQAMKHLLHPNNNLTGPSIANPSTVPSRSTGRLLAAAWSSSWLARRQGRYVRTHGRPAVRLMRSTTAVALRLAASNCWTWSSDPSCLTSVRHRVDASTTPRQILVLPQFPRRGEAFAADEGYGVESEERMESLSSASPTIPYPKAPRDVLWPPNEILSTARATPGSATTLSPSPKPSFATLFERSMTLRSTGQFYKTSFPVGKGSLRYSPNSYRPARGRPLTRQTRSSPT